MLRVGLTGNIAAGKSSVARVWQSLGARVVDADVLAREAVAPGTPALARIRDTWGGAVLAGDGSLDRAAVREIVFRDGAARARLEAIVHPEVARLRDEAFRAAEAEGLPLVVADVPLLFEVGLEDDFDVVVLVDAPEPVRAERIVRTRGLDAEAARRMIAAQMPAARKRERADFVIENDGDEAGLRREATRVWQALAARAAAGR
jgi:dephospho-CoA kinase